MVSVIRTEFAEGTVQWKPEPKPREGKDGAWTSYQIKLNDVYYDCNQKVYDAVREDEAIRFTYSTRHYQKNDGSQGTGYKISDLIGPDTLDDTIPSQETPSAPRTEAPRLGMIGSLPGAEIGAMENRAVQIGIILGTLTSEDMKGLLMQQAWLGSWFKAQQIPSLDPEVVPLQDEPGYSGVNDPAAEQGGPDWSGGPDPTDEKDPKELPW